MRHLHLLLIRRARRRRRVDPLIAGWGEDGALDTIREYAQAIDTIARRIEDAPDPKPDAPRTSAAIAVPPLAA